MGGIERRVGVAVFVLKIADLLGGLCNNAPWRLPPLLILARPAMQQYYRFKKRHPDCVLLFRVGDFYEMFDDDAVKVSQAIGLTLTQRSAGVPMAGVPHHQLENYLRRLTLRGTASRCVSN